MNRALTPSLLDCVRACHVRAAARRVRAHVGAFGGDPERITLMGHGCGAVAACTIGASPRAEGLFQNLILQSGTCASFGPNIQLGSVGLNHSQQLLRNLGVSKREEVRLQQHTLN